MWSRLDVQVRLHLRRGIMLYLFTHLFLYTCSNLNWSKLIIFMSVWLSGFCLCTEDVNLERARSVVPQLILNMNTALLSPAGKKKSPESWNLSECRSVSPSILLFILLLLLLLTPSSSSSMRDWAGRHHSTHWIRNLLHLYFTPSGDKAEIMWEMSRTQDVPLMSWRVITSAFSIQIVSFWLLIDLLDWLIDCIMILNMKYALSD